jgi:hypothetical protein
MPLSIGKHLDKHTNIKRAFGRTLAYFDSLLENY